MDRTLSNKQALEQLLQQLLAGSNSDFPQMNTQLIQDKEAGLFALFFLGWSGNQYIHNLMFHFGLKEGKIWIYENNTDCLVHESLVELGVPNEDIVFAWEALEDLNNVESVAA